MFFLYVHISFWKSPGPRTTNGRKEPPSFYFFFIILVKIHPSPCSHLSGFPFHVPGFEEPVCFVENKDPQALVDQMMSCLDQMVDVVFDKQMETFEPVFADIDQTLSDITQNDFAHESHPLHKLKEKLAQCLRVLTCVALIVANMILISSGYTCSSD